MMNDAAADQKIGVVAESLPPALDVTVEVDGQLQKMNANSRLALRVDYRANGQFVKAANWGGTAHISFLMQSAGAGARAKFTVRKDVK